MDFWSRSGALHVAASSSSCIAVGMLGRRLRSAALMAQSFTGSRSSALLVHSMCRSEMVTDPAIGGSWLLGISSWES